MQLRRAGLDVAVFEQRDRLSEINTGLSLWAFGVRRLQELGLADRVAEIGQPIERVVHRSVAGRRLGEVAVAPLSARIGAPSYEVHRSGLQRLLADAVRTAAIRFDHRCVDVREDGPVVRAEFANGQTASADLLVGADGVHSVVRRAILGAAGALARSEIGVWRGTAAVTADDVPGGLHLRIMGPGSLFGVARLSDELVRWYAGARLPSPPPASDSDCRQTALDGFGRWPEPVGATLRGTSAWLFNDTPHAPPRRAWGRGRVTLLGDAAHSSLPTLGISAGLAIEDAAALGECIGAGSSVESGLRAYEQQRRRVSARVVRTARLFGRVLMVRRQPAYRVREVGVRVAPQTLAVRWLVGGGRIA